MKKLLLIFPIIGILTLNSTFSQTIRYVKPVATGLGNGSSWANASGSIQDMIDYSNSGGQVWVAAGTYNLANTIAMKNGVSVYGGFFAAEFNYIDHFLF